MSEGDDNSGGESSTEDDDRDRNTGGRDSGPDPTGGTNDGETGGAAPATGGAAPAAGGSAPATGGSAPAEGGTSAGGSTSVSPEPMSHFEDCGVPEVIDNNDREHAQPLGSMATFCVEGADHDWFYVDTPDDGKAHVVTLDFEQEADAWFELEVFAKEDYSSLGAFHPEKGVSATYHFTVGPGTRTLFDFGQYISSKGAITVVPSVVAESDEYEPNNVREDAAPIEVGKEITAQIMVPYSSDTDRSPTDWYEIELEAGDHTLSVTEVPQEMYFGVQIYDSKGDELLSDTAPNKGALFEMPFSVAATDTYRFAVYQYVATLPVIIEGDAQFLTRPYKFKIE